jgi:hypothetical protein
MEGEGEDKLDGVLTGDVEKAEWSESEKLALAIAANSSSGQPNCRRPGHQGAWVRCAGDRGDKEELVGLLTSNRWGRQQLESKEDGGVVSGWLRFHSAASFRQPARVGKRPRTWGLVRRIPRRRRFAPAALVGNESSGGARLGRRACSGDDARRSEGVRRRNRRRLGHVEARPHLK